MKLVTKITITSIIILLAMYACDSKQSPYAKYSTGLTVEPTTGVSGDLSGKLDLWCYNSRTLSPEPNFLPPDLLIVPNGVLVTSAGFDFSGQILLDNGFPCAGIRVAIEVIGNGGDADLWSSSGHIVVYDDRGASFAATANQTTYAVTDRNGRYHFAVILGDEAIYGINEHYRFHLGECLPWSQESGASYINTIVTLRVYIPQCDSVPSQTLQCQFKRTQGSTFGSSGGLYKSSSCTFSIGQNSSAVETEAEEWEDVPSYRPNSTINSCEPNDEEPVWPKYYEIDPPISTQSMEGGDSYVVANGWWDQKCLSFWPDVNGVLFESWNWLTYGYCDLPEMYSYPCSPDSNLAILAYNSSPYIYWTYIAGDTIGAPNQITMSLDVKNSDGTILIRTPVTMWRTDYYSDYPPLDGVIWYYSDCLVPMQTGSLTGTFYIRGDTYRCFEMPENSQVQITDSVDFNRDGTINFKDYVYMAREDVDAVNVAAFCLNWLK